MVLTVLSGDSSRLVSGHVDDRAVDQIAVVVEPLPDEMIEEDVAPELVVDNERIGRILGQQIEESRIARYEESVGDHFPVVSVTGQVIS